jgi:hypothetical protein
MGNQINPIRERKNPREKSMGVIRQRRASGGASVPTKQNYKGVGKMKKVVLYYPIEKVTEKAIALRIDHNFLTWFPKSMIKAYKRVVNGCPQYKTIIPYWMAEEKGLLAKDFNGNYVYISDADIINE